jgi:hypothetical protein
VIKVRKFQLRLGIQCRSTVPLEHPQQEEYVFEEKNKNLETKIEGLFNQQPMWLRRTFLKNFPPEDKELLTKWYVSSMESLLFSICEGWFQNLLISTTMDHGEKHM